MNSTISIRSFAASNSINQVEMERQENGVINPVVNSHMGGDIQLEEPLQLTKDKGPKKRTPLDKKKNNQMHARKSKQQDLEYKQDLKQQLKTLEDEHNFLMEKDKETDYKLEQLQSIYKELIGKNFEEEMN